MASQLADTTGEALEDMAGLFKSLLAVMRAYPETPKLQRHACAAMVALSRRNGELALRAK